ncbi:MAG: hexose kinase [Oscillospiraceae bacterium]|jgi:1-phosphofructokinase family hexose kinase|nr:hexose kinase [Oscillospiraceae bacterium]
MNIFTVTLNTCFDLTLTVDTLSFDDVNRVSKELRQAGGKGIHVGKVAGRLGCDVSCWALLGEENRADFMNLLDELEPPLQVVPCKGRTRENLTIRYLNQTLKINRDGFLAGRKELSCLFDLLKVNITHGDIVAVSGSLPRGCTLENAAEFLENVKSSGALLAVDCDAVTSSVLGRVKPWVIKPNIHEFHKLTGLSIPDEPEESDLVKIKNAALEIRFGGTENVLVSLGTGGLLAVGKKTVLAKPPKVDVKSTVGAGDSALAGYIAGLAAGKSFARRAALACACGTATAMLEGTLLCSSEEAQEILSRVELKEL